MSDATSDGQSQFPAGTPARSSPATQTSDSQPHSQPVLPPNSRTHHATAAGTAVGRYVVLHRIAEGGMGVVYAAHDFGLDRRVCLKFVRAAPDDPRRAEHHQRLLTEARALARIAHPNVIGVHDVGTFGDEVFIAIEHVDGHTLRERMRRPLSWLDAVALIREAAQGLAAIHAAGLLHRDVKPENILVGADGRVRVTDLGLAVPTVSGAGVASGRAGTRSYMAPEQRAGTALGPASDQFSLCLTLLELLAGTVPNPEDAATLALRTAAPRKLRHALARGLALNPALRHRSMGALLEALEGNAPSALVRAGPPLAFAASAAVLAFAAWSTAQPRPPTARVMTLAENAPTPHRGAWATNHPELAVAQAGASVADERAASTVPPEPSAAVRTLSSVSAAMGVATGTKSAARLDSRPHASPRPGPHPASAGERPPTIARELSAPLMESLATLAALLLSPPESVTAPPVVAAATPTLVQGSSFGTPFSQTASGSGAVDLRPIGQQFLNGLSASPSAVEIAQRKFSLAQSVWNDPAQQDRALELARVAHDALATTDADPVLLRQVDDWLSARHDLRNVGAPESGQ